MVLYQHRALGRFENLRGVGLERGRGSNLVVIIIPQPGWGGVILSVKICGRGGYVPLCPSVPTVLQHNSSMKPVATLHRKFDWWLFFLLPKCYRNCICDYCPNRKFKNVRFSPNYFWASRQLKNKNCFLIAMLVPFSWGHEFASSSKKNLLKGLLS
jgi:hypothetical protein